MSQFKFPTAYTILYLLIVLVAIATWIVPAGQYDRQFSDALGKDVPVPGTYKQVEQSPQGPGAVALAPVAGFYDPKTYEARAIDVALFVIVIGGFLGVVDEDGGHRRRHRADHERAARPRAVDDPHPHGAVRRRRHDLRHGRGEPRLLRADHPGDDGGGLRFADRGRHHHAGCRQSARWARRSIPSPRSSRPTPPACRSPRASCCAASSWASAG